MARLSKPDPQDPPLERLATVRPELAVPGYWDTLGENGIRWAKMVTIGDFWSAADARHAEWRTRYTQDTGSDGLLADPTLPSFVSKSVPSIKDKLARQIEIDGRDPAALLPTTGPAVPLLHDLVRTRLRCRYLDGVSFVANELVTLAAELGISVQVEAKGSLEGYFAQHVLFTESVLFRMDGVNAHYELTCEVQIATELATRMWDASHPLYEQHRRSSTTPETWQWNPSDPRFISNQLGHMIHLADGLLVQLRNETAKAKKS